MWQGRSSHGVCAVTLYPPLPCRASPPQGGRLVGGNLVLPFSPREGEMSAKLTEGGNAANSKLSERRL